MKKRMFLISVLILFSFFLSIGLSSQEEELYKDCRTHIELPFITGTRSMKALLTGNEVAEFRTTLFDGNTYRFVLCSHQEGLIEFSVLDTNRNLLFSSTDYGTINKWDFVMEGSMECIIEAKLNNEIAYSGMAMFLIGYKYSGSNQ